MKLSDVYPDKDFQLSVVLKNNQANDNIHTWIRTRNDISSYSEALVDYGWYDEKEDLTPDFTKEDVENSLKTGNITIYSSYPIELGVFVTPSKIEATNYSKNRNAYSKKVKLTDVAWIDPIQGQYTGSK